MAKKFLLVPLFALLLWQQLTACDACGCSIGGNGIGLLTNYRSNFIGLGWQLARFQSAPGYGAGSTDYFRTFELSVRYHFSGRFKVLLYQPYRMNLRINSSGPEQRLSGLSDTRVLGAYTLVKDLGLGSQTSLFAELGAGFKIPTGAYDAQLHDRELPENFNPGNGSWGFLIQPNVVLSHRKIGLVAGGVYQHHAANASGYRFGDQLTTQLLFFGETAIGQQLKIVPNGGLSWEKIATDRYANENTVGGTGGNGTYASAGFNLKAGSWIFGAAGSLPLGQSYSHREVEAGGRFSCQLSFTF